MLSIGPFILIAGISLVVLLCWAWLPFAALAKLLRVGDHRKKDAELLPVRAAAGEVRYQAEGFVPPLQVLQQDPHAFDPEVRHHEFLRVEPRKAKHPLKEREAENAYEATFGPGRVGSAGRPRSRERRKKKTRASVGLGIQGDVQKPAATLSRNQERWENLHGHLETQP